RGKDGAWQLVDTAKLASDGHQKIESSSDGQNLKISYQVLYAPASSNTGPNTNQNPPVPILNLDIEWTIEQGDVRWSITIKNVGLAPRQIDDLAIPLPIANSVPGVEGTRRVTILKHSLVAGYTSYMFWMRNNNIGPYLMLTPREDTKFEYWDAQRQPPQANQTSTTPQMGVGYRVYIHSAAAGTEAKAQGTKWRQPNTTLRLAPMGQLGDTQSYGFKFHWAGDYDEVRQTLVDEGLIDVHVVPGMTVPHDLFARFALRTKQPINGVEAE